MMGLRIDIELPKIRAMHSLCAPRFGTASDQMMPIHIDGRGECVVPSNQGNKPQCAGETIAAIVEDARLQWLDVAEQLDAGEFYSAAKQIDGIDGEGTTLQAAVGAGADLGWYAMPRYGNGPDECMTITNRRELLIALRRYRRALGAFDADENMMHVGRDGIWKVGGAKLGGHAMEIIGYVADESQGWYEIQMKGSYGKDSYAWNGFLRMSPEDFDKAFLYGLALDCRPLK
jgi:hypothetical protein